MSGESRGSSTRRGGIGFFGLLTVLFIALKLTHQIDWAWGWVLSPLWVPTAIFLAVLAVVVGGAFLIAGAAALWQKATRPRPIRQGRR